MDQFVLEYIKMRMREMNFDHYTFAPIRIQGNNSKNIDAQNEFYYLVAKTIPAAANILSETNLFNEAADYGDFNFYQIQEFSGRISIVQAGVIDMEFIRVIPRLESSPEVKAMVVAQQILIEESHSSSQKK